MHALKPIGINTRLARFQFTEYFSPQWWNSQISHGPAINKNGWLRLSRSRPHGKGQDLGDISPAEQDFKEVDNRNADLFEDTANGAERVGIPARNVAAGLEFVHLCGKHR